MPEVAADEITSRGRKHGVLLAILTGAFALVLTNSAFNTMLPNLTAAYGVSAASAGWVIVLYMLAMTMTMPLTSLIVDRLGRKNTYLLGLAAYGLSSLAGGIFHKSIEIVFIVRFLHGGAAGLMITLSLALLFDYYGQEMRGRVVGTWGMLLTIAPAIGPAFGGAVMQFGSLQQLFWINVPFALLSFALCCAKIRRYEPALRKKVRMKELTVGFSGLAAISSGIPLVSEPSVPLVMSAGLIAVGAAALVLFVRLEKRRVEPIIRFSLLRDFPVFRASLLISTAQDIAMFGVIFVMPLLFQDVLHLPPSVAGAMFIPTAVCTSLFVWIGGHWLDAGKTLGFIVCGILFVAVSVLSFAFVQAGVALAVIIGLMALRGVGNGLSDMTMTAIGLQALPEDDVHEGSALSNTIQRLASSFAIMLLAIYYDVRWQALARSGEWVAHAKRQALQEECVMLTVVLLAVLPLVGFITKKRAGAVVDHGA